MPNLDSDPDVAPKCPVCCVVSFARSPSLGATPSAALASLISRTSRGSSSTSTASRPSCTARSASATYAQSLTPLHTSSPPEPGGITARAAASSALVPTSSPNRRAAVPRSSRLSVGREWQLFTGKTPRYAPR